jgi:hypothetical protein
MCLVYFEYTTTSFFAPKPTPGPPSAHANHSRPIIVHYMNYAFEHALLHKTVICQNGALKCVGVYVCVCVCVALSTSAVCDKCIQTGDCAVIYSKPPHKHSSTSITNFTTRSRDNTGNKEVDGTADVANVYRPLFHILQCRNSSARPY